VAMIDNEIRRTRCGICEAEHEYKEAKGPTPRRKTQPPGLFTQVLDGLQGPTARPHSPAPAAAPPDPDGPLTAAASASQTPNATPSQPDDRSASPTSDEPRDREDGPVRRPLIRAQFPKREGQEPTPRAMPEFTLQTLNNRANRPGHGKGRGRRRPGGGMDQHVGPMRSGRDQGNGFGHGDGSGRPPGQGQAQGGGGRRRRGGKKNH